jgi:hypothetical protein
MAAEQKQAEQPKWAPSEPEAAPSPTPAGIFVVYTDAQGLWAGRVAKDRNTSPIPGGVAQRRSLS